MNYNIVIDRTHTACECKLTYDGKVYVFTVRQHFIMKDILNKIAKVVDSIMTLKGCQITDVDIVKKEIAP